jgi:hypothetical protein
MATRPICQNIFLIYVDRVVVMGQILAQPPVDEW